MQTILDFLAELASNNHREWFAQNKARYELAKKEYHHLIEALIKEVGAFDSQIAPLELKQCIFRINRDIRFSKDKSPYKNNFGASLQKGGKKSPYAGYYLHIQPHNQSFIGGGVYMPPSADLAKIRQEIDYNGEELRTLIAANDFQQYFGKLQGEEVSTAPKGYAKDNPYIDLIRLKSFVMIHPLTDQQVNADSFRETVLSACKAMKPVLDFLNRALES